MSKTLVEDFEKLEVRFREKLATMTKEKIAEFDNWFSEAAPALLRFYNIHAELLTTRQQQRFLDYLYMHAVVYNKTAFDERYDQVLFSKAVEYAKAEPITISGILTGEMYSAIHRLGPRLREEYRQARLKPRGVEEIDDFLNGVLGGLVAELENYGFAADFNKVINAYKAAKKGLGSEERKVKRSEFSK
jgi:hypothetical protein